MENKKETLENYRIKNETNALGRIGVGLMGLMIGTTSGDALVSKTLQVASKMYNHLQTNPDVHIKLSQFYDSIDSLETMAYTAGIIWGGALLTNSLFASKYEIYKENKEAGDKNEKGSKVCKIVPLQNKN